jgi:hypothetical protein
MTGLYWNGLGRVSGLMTLAWPFKAGVKWITNFASHSDD